MFQSGHTLGDLWCAIAGLDQDVPALGAECGCDGLCESLDTDQEGGAGIDAELKLLFQFVSTTRGVFIASTTSGALQRSLDTATHLVSKAELL